MIYSYTGCFQITSVFLQLSGEILTYFGHKIYGLIIFLVNSVNEPKNQQLIIIFYLFLGTNASWPCHEDDEDGANSDSKTVNSDDEDDGPDLDLEGIDEFPDVDFDDTEKTEAAPDDSDSKAHNIIKGGDSIQSSLWINPNERDIEDLKR